MLTNYCHLGDCREYMQIMLDEGAAGSVQCIVTSPPGCEATGAGFADYLLNLVSVFDLARELLAYDGTLWLNLCDGAEGVTGQPWRVALALEKAGWILRREFRVGYSSQATFPELLRLSKQHHEHLFLFTKSDFSYIDTPANFNVFESINESCMKAGSRPGDIVFDPFSGGYNFNALVAKKLGRKWIGCELDPEKTKQLILGDE